MRIVWTDLSLWDLAAARAFIARENPSAADRQMERVFAAVATLLQFPEIGRSGRREGTRELVIGRTPYIAAYRLRGDRIEILRVLHERQRWPDTL
jgi:toxin ParE1/3/4